MFRLFQMEVLPGQRVGSRVYFYDVEPYHLDTRYKNSPYKYYRCASRTTDTQCDVSVYVSERGVATRYGTHNHPIDRNLKDDCRFREEIRRLSQDILLDPTEVVREASRQSVAIYFFLNVPFKGTFWCNRSKSKAFFGFSKYEGGLKSFRPQHEDGSTRQ